MFSRRRWWVARAPPLRLADFVKMAAGALTLLLLFSFLAPAVLSLLRGKTDGACAWAEHSGGLQVDTMNVGVATLAEGKARCEAMAACAGVTLAVSQTERAYYLRDGQYDFDLRGAYSPSDLVSWIKVCGSPGRGDGGGAVADRYDGLDGGLRGGLAAGAVPPGGGGPGGLGINDVGVGTATAPRTHQDQSEGTYPFPRNITIPPKKGNGIIYVLYWKETKSGCTWQGLAKVCATEDNSVLGFDPVPEATTAQMCETACCAKRGADKLKNKDKCAMFQFKQGVGCFHGRQKSDCLQWKSANSPSARGWFGGEVNSDAMERQLRNTRDSRFEEMLTSVRSIRAVMPQGKQGKFAYGVSIVSPRHYVESLEPSKLKSLEELDIDIQVVDIPDSLEPDFHSSWFFRTVALPSTPYEKTLQLDSDTILCRSLDGQEFWTLLDRYDYAATHAPSLFHEGVQPGEAQSKSMVQYNDAVIAFHWNARTREALARAMESAVSLPAFGLRDQAAYRSAVWNTFELHDYGLPPVWQCRVPRSKPSGVTCSNHAALTQSVMLKDGQGRGKSIASDSFVHDTYTQCVILHGHTVRQK